MNKILLIIMAINISACSTMNFVNGPVTGDTVKREQWHHLALVSLIELSKPFDAKYYCDNKQWEKLTVELSPSNVFSALATTTPFISLYNPWTIYYECRENIN